MSKGGGGGTNTVQRADPWVGQQPYLTDMGNHKDFIEKVNHFSLVKHLQTQAMNITSRTNDS